MTTSRRLTALLAVALAALSLAACGGGGDAPPPPAPVITSQPEAAFVTLGQPASFSVTATGTGLAYQWQRGGVAIPGATAAALTLPTTTLDDRGASFRVVVSNGGGTVTSQAALLTVQVPGPGIAELPTDQTVTEGETATFTVVGTGVALSYRWQRDGQDIPGATEASYTTAPTTAADDGTHYTVYVSNPGGYSWADAVLHVLPPPAGIDVQPAPQTVLVGETATFTVAAHGSGLAYQWQLDGVDIPGATDASYTTPSATLDHDGRTYRVIVSNTSGTVTSDPATLSVQPLVAPVRATPWVEALQTGGVALRADGTVWAWGDGSDGHLGQGNLDSSTTPVLVRDSTGAGALDRVVKISGGAEHVLALRDDGTVWAWGRAVALGASDTGEQLATLPVQVAGIGGVGVLTGVVDVSAGVWVSAAVLGDGTVVAWGDNGRGAVGAGSNATGVFVPDKVWYPALVSGATGVVQVSAGYQRVLARRADGTLLSWGHNPNGEMGRVTSGDTATPGQVVGITSAVRVTAAYQTTTAILSDGTARIWGVHGYDGSAGTSCATTSTSTPVVIPKPAGSGSTFTAAVPTWPAALFVHGGKLFQAGRLMDSALMQTCANGLVQEATSTDVVGVSRSWLWHSFTWGRDGRMHGFGDNGRGVLGLGHADPVTGLHELPGLNLLDATPPGQEVFFTDFEPGVPAEVVAGATGVRVGVQGFAGLGPAAEPFAGSFLRSSTGEVVTVTLTGLPAHRFISLGLLFAAIDSLDGAGSYPAGDYFKITLDGATLFREAFANAGPGQVQTYLPPPGVELARRVDLGFTGPGSYFTDSAYDLAADPRFQLMPHTGDTATFTFQIEGEGIQGMGDESWAMDNLRITVHP